MGERELEGEMLERCAVVATSSGHCAKDAKEANVFRLAALVMRTRFPAEYERLMLASKSYFDSHAEEELEPCKVLQNCWVVSAPRLRDMLSRSIKSRL